MMTSLVMSLVMSTMLRGAAVLAIALVAVRLLRPASASLRHAVLACALAAVVALPALAAVVPSWRWHVWPASASAGDDAAMAQRAVRSPVAEPAARGNQAAGVPAGASAGGTARVPVRAVRWGALFAAMWLAGFALGALRAVIGAVRARRIAARGEPLAVDAASAWRAVGGRGSPPRLVASADVDAPIVVGAIAPVVVVPRAAASWDAERWRVVLLHELAHVRRRDGVANAVAQLALAVQWMNPLAWLAARRLRVERELAADDAVLRGGTRASSYAEHLLAIACGAHRDVASAVAMAGGHRRESGLESRVAAMLDGARRRGTVGARGTLAVACAVAAIATVAACVTPSTSAPPASAGSDPAAPAAGPSAPMSIAGPSGADAALQAAAERELDTVIAATHATGAIAIVIDATTGAPLALAARGDGDVRAPRISGSTLKALTIAAALDAGVVDATTRVDCEHGTRAYDGDHRIVDASPNGVLDVGGVLAVSSNVCAAKIAEPLGDRLADAYRRFSVATIEHVDTRSFAGAAIAAGEGLPISPLALASAYTAFAGDGTVRLPDGTTSRAISNATAHAVLAMLGRVVDDADGTGHAARIAGVRVAGKTGTANTEVAGRNYASFVGIAPADAPRVVVLVGVDGVTGAGGEVAAPVFARIAARALGR